MKINWNNANTITVIGPSQTIDLFKIKNIIYICLSKSVTQHKSNSRDYNNQRIGIRIQFKQRAFAFYTEKLITIYESTEYSSAE